LSARSRGPAVLAQGTNGPWPAPRSSPHVITRIFGFGQRNNLAMFDACDRRLDPPPLKFFKLGDLMIEPDQTPASGKGESEIAGDLWLAAAKAVSPIPDTLATRLHGAQERREFSGPRQTPCSARRWRCYDRSARRGSFLVRKPFFGRVAKISSKLGTLTLRPAPDRALDIPVENNEIGDADAARWRRHRRRPSQIAAA